jgi:acyl-CoA hydrolase
MKIVSAAEAVSGIKSGEQVWVQAAAAPSPVLLDALVARAPELRDVRVAHLHIEGPGPHLQPGLEASFRGQILFAGPNARQAVDDGRADSIPIFLSDVPLLIRRGLLPLDAALINVSPPDSHGYCSLGTSVEATLAAVRHARTVIAQLNPSMPRTHGEGFIHVDDIDLAVEAESPLYVYESDPIDAVSQRIGEQIADLVPDGATIQLGIGAIPTAIAALLRDKRDLGIHTEMMTDSIVDLIEAGAVTGARKEHDRGKVVATLMMGTPHLYEFVDDNPMLEMKPCDYTNDTHVIRGFSRIVAINSAISIDLTGQVNADTIGWHLYSGFGGQPDFMRGAALAAEGRAIIAMPSTARGGTVSRIVPFLAEGAGVVTTRGHVRTVVTEWGVAELFGKSVRQRAQELIAVAHPDFRDELTAQARRTHYL